MLFSPSTPRNVLIYRWLLVITSWTAYILLFPIMFRLMGPKALSLSAIPVLISAWFSNLLGGIVGAITSTLINGLLMYWLGDYDWSTLIRYSYLGLLLLLFGGGLIGYMQELRHRLLNELKEKERAAAKYQSIIMSSSDGIIIVSEEGKIVEWNHGQEEITGIKKVDVIQKQVWEVFNDLEPDNQNLPAGKIQFRDKVLKAIESGEGYWLDHLSEREIENTDGRRFFIQTRRYPIQTENGYMIGIFSRDITNQKKTERLLINSEEQYRATISQSTDGIIIANENLEIIEWSEGQTRIFGYTKEEMLGKPIWQFQYQIVPEENRPPGFLEHVKKRFQEVKQQGSRIIQEAATDYEVQTKDGSRKTIQITSFPIETSTGTLLGSIIRDISEQKNFERHLQHAATHDALTDLPNRTLLLDRLDHSIARAQRNNTRLSVLYIDLDNFKEINDTFGHAAGDFVLQRFTARVLAETRKSDTFARISGDEFILIMETISDLSQAVALAEKIIELGNKPYQMDDDSFDVTISIGISYYPDDGGSSLRLIQQADAAMYSAKKAGRNNIQTTSN